MVFFFKDFIIEYEIDIYEVGFILMRIMVNVIMVI